MLGGVPESRASGTDLARVAADLAANQTSKKRRVVTKFFLAAIGSIPWVGGFLSAAAGLKADEQSARTDDLQTQWLEVHQEKIDDLGSTLADVEERFQQLGPEIAERIESEEYLALVRQAFRTWDEADTREKRRYAANL